MLRTIAFVSAMFTGFAASLYSRFYALLFYLWFAIFRPQEWVWMDIEQFRFSLIVGLFLVVPSLMTGVFPNLTHPLSVGMVCFLATALVGQMNAFDPAWGWFHFEMFARIMLVSLLLVTLVDSRDRFIQALAVVSGSLGFHASKFGMGFLMWGGARFGNGIGGPFGSNNEFALAIARTTFLLLAVSQNVKNRWIRLGFLAAVPLSCLGIVSTYSRGGFLALAAGAIVYVLLQRRRILSVTLLGATAFVLVTFTPIRDTYFSRLQTIGTYQEVGDDSALGRLHIWRVALIIARANPMGIGLRNFERAYDQYDFSNGRYLRGRSVHNSHLQALVETGYAGGAIWVLLFGYAFLTALRVRRRSKDPDLDPESKRFYFTTANALMASMTAFIVGGSFGAEMLNDLNWFTFGLVAALSRLALQPAPSTETVRSREVHARQTGTAPATAFVTPARRSLARAAASANAVQRD